MPTDEIETLNRKIDRILFYLNNDSDTGKKGVISQLEGLSHEFYTFREKIETAIAVRNGKLGLIATLGAGAALILEWAIKLFIK